MHSHESLDFFNGLLQHLPRGFRPCLPYLTRAWWTPPCAPYDALLLERHQIEDSLQRTALVSLTDHDSIEAPLALRTLGSCRDAPISFEWTVPYCGTSLHLGVHNLRPATASQAFRELSAVTAGKEPDAGPLLESLARDPGTLVVFNHPCWDETRVGDERHAETVAYFVRRYGRFIHALELNGLRPWRENVQALQMANALGKPVVSGGDRHALEANTILDLTNTSTFSEYVEQVRSGASNVYITNQYREHFGLRILRTIGEVLADHESHGQGWRSWSDRCFYRCDDGVVRSFTDLFPDGLLHPLRLFVSTVALIRRSSVQQAFRFVMTPQPKFAC